MHDGFCGAPMFAIDLLLFERHRFWRIVFAKSL